MPQVSVVIPVFNGAATVREAIDSALDQRFRDFEVIVVNDGSTDDSAQVLEQFAGRITLINQPNRGPACARNAAVKIAKGEYLAFLDADDKWMPQMLAQTVAALALNPDCVLAYCNLELIDSTGHSLGTSLIGQETSHAPSMGEMMTRIWPIMPSGALIRRSAFEQCGGFCEEFRTASLEDAHLWYLLREQGSFYYLPETLGYWRFSMFPLPLKNGRVGPEARRTFGRLLHERYGISAEKALKSRTRAPRSILGYIGLAAMRDGQRARAREAFGRALRIESLAIEELSPIDADLPAGLDGTSA